MGEVCKWNSATVAAADRCVGVFGGDGCSSRRVRRRGTSGYGPSRGPFERSSAPPPRSAMSARRRPRSDKTDTGERMCRARRGHQSGLIASLGCAHRVHQCVPACRAIEAESMPSLQMVTCRTGNQEVVAWRNSQGGNVVDLGPLHTDDAVRDSAECAVG